ncbi:MAG: DUF4350 domain-containing protein [Gemmatimonadales bacterium]
MIGRRGSRAARSAVALFSLSLAAPLPAQQVADTAFPPSVAPPAFPEGRGPTVLLDEAHFNFHTASGRYRPFATLLRRDGYVVVPNRERFSAAALARGRVLVIANALPDSGAWVLPTRAAFTPEEISAVEAWVRGGGSLLLIADHMPLAGAAEPLARAFGLEFLNGFAFPRGSRNPPDLFRTADGSLATHPVTRGRSAAERVDSVATFTGQAFRATARVTPIITLDERWSVLLPVRAWEFSDSTPRVGGAGLLQAALLRHGRGRVAVFGEAAMFTAQRAGGGGAVLMGMNNPQASRNAQFALNVLHWLSGLLEPDARR